MLYLRKKKLKINSFATQNHNTHTSEIKTQYLHRHTQHSHNAHDSLHNSSSSSRNQIVPGLPAWFTFLLFAGALAHAELLILVVVCGVRPSTLSMLRSDLLASSELVYTYLCRQVCIYYTNTLQAARHLCRAFESRFGFGFSVQVVVFGVSESTTPAHTAETPIEFGGRSACDAFGCADSCIPPALHL